MINCIDIILLLTEYVRDNRIRIEVQQGPQVELKVAKPVTLDEAIFGASSFYDLKYMFKDKFKSLKRIDTCYMGTEDA